MRGTEKFGVDEPENCEGGFQVMKGDVTFVNLNFSYGFVSSK